MKYEYFIIKEVQDKYDQLIAHVRKQGKVRVINLLGDEVVKTYPADRYNPPREEIIPGATQKDLEAYYKAQSKDKTRWLVDRKEAIKPEKIAE